MTDETLSSVLDGECSPAELDRLLEAMERDPALKARYSRMCLARDAMRGVVVKTAHQDFSARVLAALDQNHASAVVVPFRPRRLMAWQPLTGLAAAAALAAVAVLALRPESALSPGPQQVAVTPLAGMADRHWTELDADNARRLNNYLIAYRQSRAEQGVGGTLSHARYAAHPVEPTEPVAQEQPR